MQVHSSRRFLTLLALVSLVATLFATSTAQAAAPVPEGLVATDVGDVNPQFSWNPVSGATSYKIQLATDGGFSSVISTTTTVNTTYTPVEELPTGTIYARVQAKDPSGTSDYSSGIEFEKGAVDGPDPIAPGGPADADLPTASILKFPSQGPAFRWEPISGVVAYVLEIDDGPDFIGATKVVTTATAFTLTDTQNFDQTYYWRVRGASKANGTGVLTNWSEIWKYQISWATAQEGTGDPVGTRPQLESPIDLEPITDVEFVWQHVLGARTYQIQASLNADFSGTPLIDEVVKSTRYSPDKTLGNGSYFWRVRAIDEGGHLGPWSDVESFVRQWADAPVPVSPLGGGFADDPTRFEWTPIPNASHYEVQVGADQNFSPNTFKSCFTSQTTLTRFTYVVATGGSNAPGGSGCPVFGQLTYGPTWYWRVRGIDHPQTSPTEVVSLWSPTQSFTVRSELVTLLSPDNNAAVAAPVLDWAPVTGAVAYSLHIFDATEEEVYQAETYATSHTPESELGGTGPYAWYVVPINGDGVTGTVPSAAAWRHFSLIAPTTNPTLTLTGPANNLETVEMPSMTWTAYPGADDYRVQYRISGTVSWTELETDIFYTGYTVPGDPLEIGEYEWRVQAMDGNQVLATSSTTRLFEVLNIGPAPLLTPVDCPAGGACALDASPEFTWQAVPGATYYLVYLALDANLTNISRVYRVDGSTNVVPREEIIDNDAGQAYFWHVRACRPSPLPGDRCSVDPQGAEPAVDSFAFKKVSAGVVLVSPGVALPGLPTETKVANQPRFSWHEYLSTNPSDVGAMRYRIEVSTASTFASLIDSATVDQPFYTPWDVTYPEGPIYWRVRAIDVSNNSRTWSPTFTFTKESPVVLGTTDGNPVDTAGEPDDGESVTGLPTFSWTPQAFAREYVLEVYKDGDLNFSSANRVVNVTTPHTSYTPDDALPAGTYAWRLRREDADNRDGPWSPGRTFTLTGGNAPTLVTPANDTTFNNDRIVYDWVAPDTGGVASYQFQRSATSNFATLKENVETVMTRWAPTKATESGTWHWRVQALDAEGEVLSTSATRTITRTSEDVPGIPKNLTATAAGGRLKITWEAPTNQGDPVLHQYRIQLSAEGETPITRLLAGNVTTTTFNGLINGQEYAISLVAINTEGESDAATTDGTPFGCTDTPFFDVSNTHSFCTEIAWLYVTGGTTGDELPDGTILYRPVNTVTRAQMAAFLYRTAGSPAVTLPAQFFADVPPTHIFYDEIQWMAQSGNSLGYTNPEGGKPLYKPAAAVSRGSMSAFLHRFEGGTPSTLVDPFFADVNVLNVFYSDVQWMADTGLSLGTPNPPGKPLYRPSDPVTRQTMAAFMFRFDQLVNG